MAFSDLSPELITSIVSHIKTSPDPVRLASLASVSKAFQEAVEATTFSSISVTSDELHQLEDAFESQPRRRAFLGALELHIVLPTYSDAACACFERRPDQQRNDESFSESISKSFDTLAKCDAKTGSRPIDLKISKVYAPMDSEFRGEEKRAADIREYRHGRRKDLFEIRYRHSYVRLLNAEQLPSIRRVRSLTIRSGTTRHVAPAVGPLLAMRFPNMESNNWHFEDEERGSPRVRTRLRDEFSQSLLAWDPARTTKLEVRLRHYPPNNENFRNADVRGGSSMDSLSAALGQRIQASNLVKVNLLGRICVGPELFWPESQEKSTSPHWPSLQSFHVDISTVRPDGGWYLVRDPNPPPRDDDDSESEDDEIAYEDDDDEQPPSEDDDEYYDSDESFFEKNERPPDDYKPGRDARLIGSEPVNNFRTHPASETVPLFQAAARAVACMPKIRMFAAEIFVSRCGASTCDFDQKFGFTFLSSGTTSFEDENGEDVQKSRLYWKSPRGWRMDDTNEALWSEILGATGTMRYKEWKRPW